MKKIKKTQAKGFYIFGGEVAANSNFIETLDEAKQFLIYANFFLRDYVTIYDYNITRHEWHMVVKLRSKKEILDKTDQKDKFWTNNDLVWRIVSEQMRLFLSQYVKCVNRMRGRTGTLVHSSYERYYFDSLKEAKQVVDEIREQTFRMFRRKPKYRGMKSHYRIPKKLGTGSIFLCSRDVKLKKHKGRNYLESQYLSKLSELVLVKLIEFTKRTNIPKIPTLINHKRE